MPIFYKKTLNCGCTILALTTHKEDDIFILGGHSYKYICDKCKLHYSENEIEDRLEHIYMNDNKITKNDNNEWRKIK